MGFLLPAFSFTVSWVGADKLLAEYDRVFAVLTIDGAPKSFRAAFHYPTGKLAKGKRYGGGSEDVWVKDISDNRLAIVFGEVDPAADVNYANAVEINDLPV
jgi:hypothetical protein